MPEIDRLRRRRLLTGAPLALALPLAGCGGALDELIGACLDWDGPEFVTGSGLPAATLGRAYSTTVEARIVREPYDDYFRYSFRLRGSLPPGLSLRTSGSSRRVDIVGTPTATGSYAFGLEVTVTDPNAGGTGNVTLLCWYFTERGFTLPVGT